MKWRKARHATDIDAARYPIRLASVAHGVTGRESGVRRLILEQAAIWLTDPRVEVGLFIRCEAGAEGAWRGAPGVVAVTSSRLGILGRLLAREWLSLRVVLWRPDVIYLRHSTVSPSLILLALLFPTVVGGDLDDLDELRIRSKTRYAWARIARDLLLRRARQIMVVTAEIGREASITGTRRPVAVFPNSIDLSSYPELPAPKNRRPHLVFLGAPRLPWAGVDKIERLAHLFPDWQFDLVGPGRDELREPPVNLVAHGPLEKAQYLPIMAAADIGIGPLALHRKGLSEASALKVAEYLAYGMPVITASAEAAFPQGAAFLLRIPNTEENVDTAAGQIRAFVEDWKGRRVERVLLDAIDARSVERRRVDLIVECLSRRATPSP